MSVSDIHTGIVTTVGWSIKSELGASPTLLNASKSTNFTYEIIGLDARYIDEINSINSQTKIIDRIRAIRDHGAMLEFHSLANKNFASNLTIIDSAFPRVLADALLHYYEGNSGLLSDAVSVLTDKTTTKCSTKNGTKSRFSSGRCFRNEARYSLGRKR